jgi:hypothetical protein
MFPELDKAVVDRCKNSAAFRTQTGASASDPRIYAWFPEGDVVYTEGQQEIAVIYRFSVTGRPGRWSWPWQLSEMQLFLRVLSINQLKLGQITETLIGLFDLTIMETTNYSVKDIILLSVNDGLNEGAPTHPIHVRNLSFRFSQVFHRE